MTLGGVDNAGVKQERERFLKQLEVRGVAGIVDILGGFDGGLHADDCLGILEEFAEAIKAGGADGHAEAGGCRRGDALADLFDAVIAEQPDGEEVVLLGSEPGDEGDGAELPLLESGMNEGTGGAVRGKWILRENWILRGRIFQRW